ncbi:MAG: hypothetical protein QOI53_2028 [Verrucomicrobiota bacterium]|nr:hypothetical protein [Verrucomicrobiota bacterium]
MQWESIHSSVQRIDHHTRYVQTRTKICREAAELSIAISAVAPVNNLEFERQRGAATNVVPLIYQLRARILPSDVRHFDFRSQESLIPVPRKTILSLLTALSLIFTVSHSSAGLGLTLAQFRQQYGNPSLDQEEIGGRIRIRGCKGRLRHCCFLS